MAHYSPQCFYCKNYTANFRCKAFERGIPEIIIQNKVSHSKPFKDDNGIRYEEEND